MGSAAVWICSYAPYLVSGGRGPTAEGMLTLPVDSHQMHLFTHPNGVRLASAPRAAHLSPGARLQVGDYALQVVLLAPHGDGNPAYDAAFAHPGGSISCRTLGREEEASWEEALLSWFGLGEEDRNPPPRPDYPSAPVDAYPPPRAQAAPAPAHARVVPRAVVSVDADSNAATGTKATGTKATVTKATTKKPDATQGAAAELEALRARLAALEAAATTGTIRGGGDDGDIDGSRRDGTGRPPSRSMPSSPSPSSEPAAPSFAPVASLSSASLSSASPSRRREASPRVVPSTGPARLEPFATDGYDTPAWVKAATMRHRAVSDSDSDEDDVPSASRFASRASTTEPEAAIPATKGVKDTPAVVRNSRASVAGTVAASVGGSTDGELDALRARLESAASERASKVADAAAPKGTAAEPLVGDDVRSFGSLVRARAAMFGGVR